MTQLILLPVKNPACPIDFAPIDFAVADRTGEDVETVVDHGFTELSCATLIDSEWYNELGPVVDRCSGGLSLSAPSYLGECWSCDHKAETNEPSEECPICNARTMEYIPQG